MDNLFKTAVSLNRFHTIQCSSKDDAEFVFSIANDIFDNFHKSGKFELTLYHKGQQEDLELNGWTFAAVNQCTWIDAAYQKHTHVKINCIDPNGDNYLIEVSENTKIYCQAAPALYMNAVMVASLCSNRKELKQVLGLFDFWNFPEITNLCDLRCIEPLKVFAEAIKRNEENKDIPRHFILFAKAKYKSMVKYFKEHVNIEELLEELAPELDDF